MNNGGLGNRGTRDTVSVAGFSLTDRNKPNPGGKPRVWGMFFYVIDTVTPANSTRYELVYGEASTNIFDNDNWVEFTGGGGGTTTLKVQSFDYDGTNTGVFEVSNGTIATLLLVEVNGDIQEEGVNFDLNGQEVDFGAALPGTGTVQVFYYEVLSIVKPDYTATYKSVADAAYTLLESDLGKTILLSNVGDITVTIPAGLSNGFQCVVRRRDGSGTVTYQDDGTSSIEAVGLIQSTDNTSVYIQHFGSNVYGLDGNLS